MANSRRLTVWQFSDGKPGHENQSTGLIEAMRAYTTLDLFPLPPRWSKINCPAPDMLLGAGHKTHAHVLLNRKRYGGKSVILMKPSLPIRCFDYCVIPEHDNVDKRPNVIQTKGVLNRIKASTNLNATQALILIGGASKHYHWHDDTIIAQLKYIVHSQPAIHFTLTTSRRSPESFLQQCPKQDNLNIVPWQQTDKNWLFNQLQQGQQIWVSPDSVSMIYEALSSGAKVGVFDLVQKKNNRVIQGVQQLIHWQYITPFQQWKKNNQLSMPPTTLSEADRVAKIIVQWLN